MIGPAVQEQIEDQDYFTLIKKQKQNRVSDTGVCDFRAKVEYILIF